MVGWQAQQSGKAIGKANALIVRMAGLGLNMIIWAYSAFTTLKMKDLFEQNITEHEECSLIIFATVRRSLETRAV